MTVGFALTYFLIFFFSVPYDLKKSKPQPYHTKVLSTVNKVLNSNGYSEVNLAKLFSNFSF